MSERKSKEMNEFLDTFTKDAFGKTITESKKEYTCVMCKNPEMKFRDRISQKEYNISGMCQTCQDKVFGETNFYAGE